jgi:hypothetical protein
VLPVTFLVARAVELLLKTYLLCEGVEHSTLKRRFGHNLEELFTEAQSRGINQVIGERIAESIPLISIITLMNCEYSDKRLEYPEGQRQHTVLDHHLARTLAQRLVQGIEWHLSQRS